MCHHNKTSIKICIRAREYLAQKQKSDRNVGGAINIDIRDEIRMLAAKQTEARKRKTKTIRDMETFPKTTETNR